MIAQLEIHLDAIQRNASRLRNLVAPAQLWPVVKSNAYGHGLIEITSSLESEVAGFCVYAAEEALAMREAGIQRPILVLGPIEPAALEAVHRANITITIWNTGGFLDDIVRVAQRHGRPLHVHAKLDTGVTRFGLDAPRAADAIASFLSRSEVRVRGVFTHLAAVEECDSPYTLEQLQRFEGALTPIATELRNRGVKRHAAASAAAMLFPQSRLDLVRAGIATYGLWPSPQTHAAVGNGIELEPALTWRSTLVVVREVEAGRSIGYGCTHHTTRPSRIGVVPLGYAEGIPRAASNKGAMLIAGTRAPVIGRICMNATLLDVTDIPQAHAGSPVTLLGQCGDALLHADEWASWAGTINYEIIARLPTNVPRRFTNLSLAPLPAQ